MLTAAGLTYTRCRCAPLGAIQEHLLRPMPHRHNDKGDMHFISYGGTDLDGTAFYVNNFSRLFATIIGPFRSVT
eukprot:SAG22_NODE_897_length_6629_cov_4.853446_4_plen_74_part_00